MDRLTVPDERIDGGLRRAIIDACEVRKEAMTIYWRLKKYEDTGLTPEEILDGKLLAGWIPVSEQLPDEPKFFLVTFAKQFGGYDIEYCYYECEKWFIVADGDNSENKAWREEMKSVVAWMPRPEPYRPEPGKE